MMGEAETHGIVDQTGAPGGTSDPDTAAAWSCLAALRGAAARFGDAPALWHDGRTLSHRQLARRAGLVVEALTAAGVGSGQAVVVCLPRDFALPAAIVGVLRAGAYYVPLAPDDPPARLSFQIIDAAPRAVITTAALAGLLAVDGAAVLEVDTLPWAAADARPALETLAVPPPDDRPAIAYMAYTSGSTGRPKGALNTHRAVDALLSWCQDDLPLGPGDAVVQRTSLGFDVAMREILWPLSVGARLVLPAADAHLDPAGLLHLMAAQRVTVADVVPSVLAEMLAQPDPPPLPTLRRVMCGGEILGLDLVRRFCAVYGAGILDNQYGPAECALAVSRWLADPAYAEPVAPIGRAFPHLVLSIVDEALAPVPPGTVGEILISGPAVGAGYWQRPEESAARFLDGPLPGIAGERHYRTGDLGRLGADGLITCLGRGDGQVKINGVRIETGEVEAALSALPAVEVAAVLPAGDRRGHKRLVAYVQPRAGQTAPDADILAEALAANLVRAAIPTQVVVMPRLPRLPNGKIDRKALPPPPDPEAERAAAYRAGRTVAETTIAAIWQQVLEVERVGVLDSFFALGGSSVQAGRMIARVNAALGVALPVIAAFTHRTPAALAEAVAEWGAKAAASVARPLPAVPRAEDRQTTGGRDIAIIGATGRFPGAGSVEALWALLLAGGDGITRFAPQDLDPSVRAEDAGQPNYVPARGIVADADRFDPAFYGITRAEAALTDPQHRQLLDCAAELLDSTGYLHAAAAHRIGVYVGVGDATYRQDLLARHPELPQVHGTWAISLGNDKEYAASRIAHRLGLTGPAVAVQSACSTSLVAITLAVDALRAGRCALALAGGFNLNVPQKTGHLYQEGAMLSPDGQCRPFDAAAAGTLFNDGGGLVLLKPLAEAERDGDPILAVIKGVGLSNDGADKASFTAPSVAGQAAAVAAALADAGVTADSVSYIEAHGTATPLGDPIEVAALRRAYGDPAQGVRWLGSGKSVIGHLVTGAGVAGVIKTVQALRHGILPPTRHFSTLNPQIDDGGGRWRVVGAATPWTAPAGQPLRAGVSSMGVGGTNAHVILQQAPEPTAPPPRPLRHLTLSAPSEAALAPLAEALAARLETEGDAGLEALLVAQHRRLAHRWRATVPAPSATEAARALRAGVTAIRAAERPLPVALLLPGQGSQYAGMARRLAEAFPAFAAALEAALEALPAEGRAPVRAALLAEPDPMGGGRFAGTDLAQPAIAAVEIALARTLEAAGIQPSVYIGHSLGEMVAAHLAGVMGLDDLMRAVWTRGQLLGHLAPGRLLAVRAEAAAIVPLLGDGLAVAAINGPGQVVVAGAAAPVDALAEALTAREIGFQVLPTSHAFHSPMVDDAIAPFQAVMQGIALSPPRVPILSTVTAAPLTAAEATDPAYWGWHMRRTVNLAGAVDALAALGPHALVEAGPRGLLASLARRIQGEGAPLVVAMGRREGEEAAALGAALGTLWSHGQPVDWAAVDGPGHRRPVAVLPMAWRKVRCWIEGEAPEVAPAMADPVPVAPAPVAVPADAGPAVRALLAEIGGEPLSPADDERPFLELGFDSLMLTQVGLEVKRRFGLTLGQRALLEEVRCPAGLIARVGPLAVPPVAAPAPLVSRPAAVTVVPVAQPTAPAAGMDAGAAVRALLAEIGGETLSPADDERPFLDLGFDSLMLTQVGLEVKRRFGLTLGQRTLLEEVRCPAGLIARIGPLAAPTPAPAPAAPLPVTPPPPVPAVTEDAPKPFGAQARVTRHLAWAPNERQRRHVADLIAWTNRRTPQSKAHADLRRPYLADPRTVAGFNPLYKEMVYPVVVERSQGAHLWDIDGNRYVDMFGGFGANLLGHRDPEVEAALQAQLASGLEIGPMHPLAGEVAELISRLTGHERVTFCNTGSEAVAGALRAARTVTGRDVIVTFSHAYHGIFDEVIVRSGRDGRSRPGAPGIPPGKVAEVIVLDYGSPQALEHIRALGDSLAAVLVEPVQSRQLDLQPREFLHELRGITERCGAALIMDEMITGFRCHPGGAQAHFGVMGDLATYGKIIGGGLPMAAIAGNDRFMGAFDGGRWRFGDGSIPEHGLTYFAGTFVRHPLALAAAKAALSRLLRDGPALQQGLDAKAAAVVAALRAAVAAVGAPFKVPQFSSAFRVQVVDGAPLADLIFYHLRARDVFIQDDRTWFLTCAHTEDHLGQVVAAFRASLEAMAADGLFSGPPGMDAARPPVPGARLGRDPSGAPAWFLPDPARPGKFRRVD